MDWKEVRFRVTNKEYELLEKLAKKKKLKHGVDQIFGNYCQRLLKKTFNYEVDNIKQTLAMAQPYLDAFYAGELPTSGAKSNKRSEVPPMDDATRRKLRNLPHDAKLPYTVIKNTPNGKMSLEWELTNDV